MKKAGVLGRLLPKKVLIASASVRLVMEEAEVPQTSSS